MFPQIIDLLTIDNSHHFLALDNSSVVTAVELSLTDLESIPVIDADLAWQSVLQNLKLGAHMRLHLHRRRVLRTKTITQEDQRLENLASSKTACSSRLELEGVSGITAKAAPEAINARF